MSGTASLRDSDGVSNIVPGRYLVVYRNGVIPANDSAPENDLVQNMDVLGISIHQTSSTDDAASIARLAAQNDVEYVLHDRYVEGHQISIVGTAPTRPIDPNDPADYLYRTPQNWAVVQAGGFGANIAGGPSYGPWNTTKGAGARIAVLDSGVDRNHPDIAPNLALNLSEVDQAAFPSACDDGSPQDQHGHGTWTASLATGAAGTGTGGVIGVAPQATLLNIKVLQRLPAGTTGGASSCAAGQTGGLLSWVLQGINDAIANKADVVSMSLGSVIDLYSGDGAGWKASFDRVTHAAALANVVLVAAVGNDSLNLSGGRFIELPAQARDVLPVVASTNPACAEDLAPNAPCVAGPVTRPYYSNFGDSLNAIAAPGGSAPNVSETGVNGWVRGACPITDCFDSGNSGYAQAIGTSASAPLVAGAAALLHAAHPGWTAAYIVNALRNTAIHTHTMTEQQLNTAAALHYQ
jgi:subtilisin family serine protease